MWIKRLIFGLPIVGAKRYFQKEVRNDEIFTNVYYLFAI